MALATLDNSDLDRAGHVCSAIGMIFDSPKCKVFDLFDFVHAHILPHQPVSVTGHCVFKLSRFIGIAFHQHGQWYARLSLAARAVQYQCAAVQLGKVSVTRSVSVRVRTAQFEAMSINHLCLCSIC